jgi:hypothetical protein
MVVVRYDLDDLAMTSDHSLLPSSDRCGRLLFSNQTSKFRMPLGRHKPPPPSQVLQIQDQQNSSIDLVTDDPNSLSHTMRLCQEPPRRKPLIHLMELIILTMVFIVLFCMPLALAWIGSVSAFMSIAGMGSVWLATVILLRLPDPGPSMNRRGLDAMSVLFVGIYEVGIACSALSEWIMSLILDICS